VLARARAEPGTLALGIDAEASRMADAASRAARRPARGGAPNARFLVSAAETLPDALAATADIVTVQFPWSSLLRGILLGEPAVVVPIAGLLKPSPASELHLLLSVVPRDGALGIEALDERAVGGIAAGFNQLGMEAIELRPASAADLVASHSTWARRLRAGTSARQAWLLRFGVRHPQRRYARATGQEGRARRRVGGTIKERG
jgi:16S rRNA (adenine(1408)-N(1))-methyltransferase